MKTNQLIFIIVLAITLFSSCDSCELFKIEDEPGVSYKTATLSHAGFDFSAGISDTVKWENNDGDVVNWSPVDPQKRNKLWYRPGFGIKAELPPNNSQKNMGMFPLDSIFNVPSTFDPDPDPLAIGNSYVVKCLDGYAKFKVLELGDGNDGGNWWAKVEYEFSSTEKFDK